jgi:tRNA(guanine-26,N2-N2) methyltransferase
MRRVASSLRRIRLFSSSFIMSADSAGVPGAAVLTDAHTISPSPLSSSVSVPRGFSVVCEGGAAVLFRSGEVFYNPVQLLNRDLSVLALLAWDASRCARAGTRERAKAWGARGEAAQEHMPPLRIFEALSATGLRSLRYAAELPRARVGLIVANDLEPAAAAAIRANVAVNGDAARAIVPSTGDANLVLALASRGLAVLPGMDAWCVSRNRVAAASGAAGEHAPLAGDGPSAARPDSFLFDNVDLDPYGSAAPFLDASLASLVDGGLLAVTCTDMAVLAGAHMDTCRARYGAIPARGKHFGEQALRILLGTIETAANRQRKTVRALASVCVDFYVRVFVTVHNSPLDAVTAGARLANLHQCTGCDAFWLWPLGRSGKDRVSGLAWPGDGAAAAREAAAAACAPAAASVDNARAGGGDELVDDGAAENVGGGADARSAIQASRKDRRAAKRAGVRLDASGGAESRGGGGGRSIVTANLAPDLPCACPHCGRPIVVGGPLWHGPIHDAAFVASLEALALDSFGLDGAGGARAEGTCYDLRARSVARSESDGGSNGALTSAACRRRLQGVLRSIVEELPDVPLYYDAGALASRLRAAMIPLPDLFAAIENAGFRASGSHAAPGVVKTDAPPAVMWEILRAVRARQTDAASAGRREGAEAAAALTRPAAPPPHASFVGAAASLAALPFADALTSPLSLRPSDAELPAARRPISFEHSDALRERLAARRDERNKGGGQRFVANPGPNWGPRARATGVKRTADGSPE